MSILIKELSTKEEMLTAFPVVNQMYEKMSASEFSTALDEMILRNDYKMVAAFSDGKMIGACGYWVAFMLYCGRYLQASTLVVASDIRGQGVGKKILHHLEKKAKEQNCRKLVLDSYTENKKSHSLYFRENFYIRGFHFMKDL